MTGRDMHEPAVPLLRAIASMARCDSDPVPIRAERVLPGLRLMSSISSFGLLTPRLRIDRECVGCVTRHRDQREILLRIVGQLAEQQRN